MNFLVAFVVAGWIAIMAPRTKRPQLFTILATILAFLIFLAVPSSAFGSWMAIVGFMTGYLIMSAQKEADTE